MMTTTASAKYTVMSFLKCLNEEEFDDARKYADEDLKFEGVLGSRNGAEDYFNDMNKMKLKYHLLKTFADGTDVCVLYDVTMSGVTVFACGWYQVEHHKITSIKVVFDPRPLLHKQNGN